MLTSSLQVGLKEWATVCRAHAQGRQLILLRKGGISEAIGGFEIEHRQFLFFPTYLHQNLEMLKPAEHAGFQNHAEEPSEIEIASAGQITDILQLQSRQQMDALDDEHLWTSPLIDMRFNYRPKNPLYLLIVRAYRLASPVTIRNTPDYAGCKSWVPLEKGLDTSNVAPVLDDSRFAARRRAILSKLEA